MGYSLKNDHSNLIVFGEGRFKKDYPEWVKDDPRVFYIFYYFIKKQYITIGRRGDNDVIINKSCISRLHAELKYAEGEVLLNDGNSKLETFIA